MYDSRRAAVLAHTAHAIGNPLLALLSFGFSMFTSVYVEIHLRLSPSLVSPLPQTQKPLNPSPGTADTSHVSIQIQSSSIIK